MNENIKYITDVSSQDKNALANLNYQNLDCAIDFIDILVEKPWGSEYLLFENEFCAIWVLYIKYMENTSMHCHPQKDTSLVSLDAKVSCNTLNDSYKLDILDGVFLNKKIFHQTQSISKEGSFILEIETPINKFDLVRINDTYGRQGKEYEDKKHYKSEKNLSLSFPNHLIKNINNTKIELINLSDTSQLDSFDENSIVSILSKHKDSGKIFKLKDISLPMDVTILIISTEDKK